MGCRYHAAVNSNGDLIEWGDTHYRVKSKVFETIDEAVSYAKDLISRGGLTPPDEAIHTTTDAVTHYYLGDGLAEPIEDFFGLIKEAKGCAGKR